MILTDNVGYIGGIQGTEDSGSDIAASDNGGNIYKSSCMPGIV